MIVNFMVTLLLYEAIIVILLIILTLYPIVVWTNLHTLMCFTVVTKIPYVQSLVAVGTLLFCLQDRCDFYLK
jgi:hypothetical protein